MSSREALFQSASNLVEIIWILEDFSEEPPPVPVSDGLKVGGREVLLLL
jgi:hypothetical protein